VASIDLPTAARLAKESACREVNDAMEASGRYNPGWEVHELGMSHAIRNGLLAHFRTVPKPRPRVAQEYAGSVIGNFRIPFPRVFDLAVLYPLVPITGANPPGYAWSPENTAALGLIEVKKDSARAYEDADRLSQVALQTTVKDQPPLNWVLLIIFFAGRTRNHVCERAHEIKPVLHKLELITQPNPQLAQGEGSEEVASPWFDVVGYGQTVPASAG
jgi:hypothetical protein